MYGYEFRFLTVWLQFLSIYLILPSPLGPGVYSASNRNEYQKHKNNVSGE
jgi:p-aminobenzoyl-glutamate transporter AbgT